MSTLRKTGERGAIRRLAQFLPTRGDVRVAIGDDVAVVKTAGRYDLLLTSDAVVEGTHFLPQARPESIGHKAVGRALSDIAAAGGEPLWALIDLVAPAATELRRLEKIYQGLSRLAARYNLAVVGGDMAQGPTLELHVFAVGRVPRKRALLRSGARPGDAIYVTGTLGGSLSGKHLAFEPRIREGLFLRKGCWATAAIDISDGLATDLRHILARSGVGADIEAGRIPLSAAARRLRGARSPLERALLDGEDFELLFTVPEKKAKAFERAWGKASLARISRIGRITDRREQLRLAQASRPPELLARSGFEHFT